jgi:hypothetical protein
VVPVPLTKPAPARYREVVGEDGDPEDVSAAPGASPEDFDDEPDPADFADPPAAPPRPVAKTSWRRRTAGGALLTGMAMGFQQVFEEKRDEPSITMETSGAPPEDLAVEGTLDGLSPRRSVVKIRPWLLEHPADPAPEE